MFAEFISLSNKFAKFISLISLPSWFACVQEEAQEEFGWKLVHGDVFRPPRKGMLLSLFLASGVQIFFMAVITLCTFISVQFLSIDH